MSEMLGFVKNLYSQKNEKLVHVEGYLPTSDIRDIINRIHIDDAVFDIILK
jgi:hypothetical protein